MKSCALTTWVESASAPPHPTLRGQWLAPLVLSPTSFMPPPPQPPQPLREVSQAREALPYSHHLDLPVSAVPHPGGSFLLKWIPLILPSSSPTKGPLRQLSTLVV